MELPEAWVTAGHNQEVWGAAGTYKEIPFEALPPVTLTPGDPFAWLRPLPDVAHGMTFEHQDTQEVPAQLKARVSEARKLGLTIPPELVTFLCEPELNARVPSCTACYYDLGARLVRVPGENGPARLLRFMNDQQACFLWYVLLEPGGGHRVAVAVPDWNDDRQGDSIEHVANPREVAICAASFEEFIKRFWIENTLWFAVQKGNTLEGELRAYADAAKKALASGLAKYN